MITTIPEEITGEPEDITVSEDTIGEADGTTTLSVTTDTTDTTSAKAVTSAYMNEGSAFDSEAEVPSLPKMLTVSAVAVTAAISIICGAVLIIKKKH